MARAFIGIGSNLGDRLGHIQEARAGLAALPDTWLVAFSSIYETAPVGPVAQGQFLNAAAELETTLEPGELLAGLAGIENRAGREPRGARQHWGPRTLDLDILFYDERVIQTPDLVVPHPRLHDRWFVIKPLADLAPAFVHPVLQRSVGQLLQELEAAMPPGPPGPPGAAGAAGRRVDIAKQP